jgi:4a-hydroxytetrahydrobiopterin dehydratase
MPEKLTSTAFDALAPLPDWRILLRRIEADFSAATYSEAAAFVVQIATAADAAAHHPDVDLRYPGRVHVALTTHASGGLTTLDADLAATISALAVETGLVSDPHRSSIVEIAIDALDIDAVRPFWKAVLGYIDERVAEGEQIVALYDPVRIGPSVWFQQMDEPRRQRNRLHFDVVVPADIALERVDAAIAAGGTLVSADSASAFWVLADVEGNEACVCTWLDRD